MQVIFESMLRRSGAISGDGEWPDLCAVYMPVRSAVLRGNQAMAGERENKILLVGFLLKSSVTFDLIITRKS